MSKVISTDTRVFMYVCGSTESGKTSYYEYVNIK